MKPADVKSNAYIDSSEEINDKNPKFKMVIMWEYQNIRMFLQNVTLKIGLKVFVIKKKLKILCLGHMLLIILMKKKLLEHLTKMNGKKQIKVLELKKEPREKVINYMLNRKNTIIPLIVGYLDWEKRDSIYEWIFSRTKISRRKNESWIRLL